MAERLLSVKVRADVADFLRGAGLVEDATRKMGETAKRSGEESKRGLGAVAQSMRDNQQAWSQVGGALTTYGAAVTGVATAVAATGISYNQLRQTSVAALTTMTGSAEAANRQMDRLDDFASNSPFARDVFIRAQQQLIGFGFEAERVVPILDAIQNAVAATGGSNQDIAELTRIIAQVGAAGKITAEDLNQFGQRGVDAATLIGDQMGFTGQEIRDQITKGTLDAGAALDALVLGMQETYGGAADNVKNTFAGAVDRVKAAFRDLSSLLMEPLVSRDGGGFLQDAMNGLADFLRMIERLPTPVLHITGGLGALSGAASLAVGGFMLLAPRIVETYDALGKLGRAGEIAQTGMRGVSRLVAPGAALIAGLTLIPALLNAIRDAANESIPGIEGVGAALLDVVESGSVASLDDQIEALGIRVNGLSGMAEGPITDLQGAFSRLADPTLTQRLEALDEVASFGMLRTSKDDVLDYFSSIDGYLTQLVQGGNAETATQLLNELWDAASAAGMDRAAFDAIFGGTIEALQGLENEARLAGEGAAAAGEGFEDLGADVDAAKEEAEEAQKAFDGLRDTIASLGDALLGVRGSARDYEAQLDRIKEAMKDDEWKATLDITTEAGRENQAMLDGLASSTTGYASAALTAGASAEEVALIMRRGREDFIANAEAMGMASEDAATLADNLGLVPDNVELMFRSAGLDDLIRDADGVVDYAATLEALIDLGVRPEVADQMIHDFIGSTAQSYVATIPLSADDAEAQRIRQELVDDIDASEGYVSMFGEPSEAQRTRQELVDDIDKSFGYVRMFGDDAEGRGELAGLLWAIDSSTGSVTINAAAANAYSTLRGFLNSIPRSVSIAINALPGPLGALSRFPGFETGGYTGDLSPKEPAGVVHGREFVSTATTVADPVNRSALEYMHAGGSMRDWAPVAAAQQWTSSYAPAPAMAAAPPARAPEIDYDRLAAAMSQIQVIPQIGDEQVYRGSRRGAVKYGPRAEWGQGGQEQLWRR